MLWKNMGFARLFLQMVLKKQTAVKSFKFLLQKRLGEGLINLTMISTLRRLATIINSSEIGGRKSALLWYYEEKIPKRFRIPVARSIKAKYLYVYNI